MVKFKTSTTYDINILSWRKDEKRHYGVPIPAFSWGPSLRAYPSSFPLKKHDTKTFQTFHFLVMTKTH